MCLFCCFLCVLRSLVLCLFFFFFFKQKTAYEMRISDWSSDVCSSDLIPVNVSGGLLSKGHPIGATGVANLYELSLHLRGDAGARQVEGARMGLAHVVGLGTCSAVHILEKA